MKNPLNRDDFEFYLEQEVNQHRMYPSDKIWRNIQQDIHGYKKWPALTVITLFVISALVVGTVLIKPQKQTITASAAKTAAEKADDSAAKLLPPPENAQEHFSAEHITQQTIARVKQEQDIDITDNIGNALSAYNNGFNTIMPAENIAAIADNTITDNNTVSTAGNNVASPAPQAQAANVVAAGATAQKAVAKKDGQPAKAAQPGFNWLTMMPNADISLNGQSVLLPNSSKLAGKKTNTFMFSLFGKRDNVPYAGLSLDNSFTQPIRRPFTLKPKSHRFDFSFYAAPSISYRSLSYGKQASANRTYISGLPYNANYTVDLGRTIHNKPAAGYEVGAALGYKLNDVLTIRGGFQFNMRDYDIEAYKRVNTYSNLVPGNTPLGGIDVSNQSSASLNGNDKTTLQNRYYQLSAPISLDARVWHNGRFAAGVEGSVQPTYIFDKDPFIITSDYKSYTDGSKLVRNWNLNTGFATYLSYTTGQFKWRLGPQFRYQALSTLSGDYPIKEHLFDYGVKIGFVKTF